MLEFGIVMILGLTLLCGCVGGLAVQELGEEVADSGLRVLAAVTHEV